MHRVNGLEFRAGVFTNLTQDHLDFHGTMDSYREAKSRLFSSLHEDSFAITNADDPSGARVVEGTAARIVTYGLTNQATISAVGMAMGIHGITLSVRRGEHLQSLESSMAGSFNASNILAAYATGVSLGLPDATVAAGIRALKSVRGRFEQIHSPQGWTAIVDYAHTPDALEHCLQTIHELLSREGSRRIITVFGCGGNRDRGKRSIMGRIASKLSDLVFVTSDNPRKEDPDAIIGEILAGIAPGRAVRKERDRRKAIRLALGEAQPGDVVLVAGKGHEQYQVIGDTKVHFDDREEIESYLRETA
jgi:UDP-N-acetylmuramoyl-L-alanyl-D-glutamate--2,6-diaminopimelate ligase